jgi:uncharacterized protein (TIGR02466 family)
MIKSIFPIDIYETKYENFEIIKESAVSELLLLDLQTHDHTANLLTSVMSLESSTKILTSQPLTPIVNFIKDHLDSFWSHLKYNGSPVISHIWVQKYEKNGHCFPHHHNPHSLSGCFYINATPSHGNLRLQNPNENMLSQVSYQLRSDIEFRTPGYFDHRVNVEDGKLIFFPSYLWHRSEINKLSDPRIVLAFNIN